MSTREIKFRVWDSLRKEMVPVGREIHMDPWTGMPMADHDNSCSDPECCGGPCPMWGPDHDTGIVFMQYTGIRDRNGTEIYEGDIVRCVNEHVGAVEWEAHDACFNVTGYYSGYDDYPTMAFMEGQPFEVIGNIHQHPELLTP